ncbi:S-locus glycoprotein domain-containing protein [Artemisia annua]|uniref:non-specific serine/threonine protein kinase n=1 Tax=Artemisia annua TaxID=35608 RepID=A0A2U1MKZ0_ARTAN|nr:S-locus glycoprotein domain-containing protein [Artemisia annua]
MVYDLWPTNPRGLNPPLHRLKPGKALYFQEIGVAILRKYRITLALNLGARTYGLRVWSYRSITCHITQSYHVLLNIRLSLMDIWGSKHPTKLIYEEGKCGSAHSFELMSFRPRKRRGGQVPAPLVGVPLPSEQAGVERKLSLVGVLAVPDPNGIFGAPRVTRFPPKPNKTNRRDCWDSTDNSFCFALFYCLKEMILMEEATILVLLVFSLHMQKIYTAEVDIISDSSFLTENDTLVSPARTFELGFFNPGSSDNTYVGIWYKKISVKTVVWVANRDYPITNVSSSILRIDSVGNLVLKNYTDHVVWSSNSTSSGNATAQLYDSGNLVITDGNSMKILWESFDHPTDTFLPGMKIGKNYLTGAEWHLTSWKSIHDPAIGEFIFSVDTHGYPHVVIRDGLEVKSRAGPWNGERFSGSPFTSMNTYFPYNMNINEKEAVFNLVYTSVITKITLTSSGNLEFLVWQEDKKTWKVIAIVPRDICDTYKICGPYGSCNTEDGQKCSCLDEAKFEPINKRGWVTGDWTGGCVRRIPLDCKNGTDGFIKYSNVKLPDTQTSWFNNTMSLTECKAICLQNCTCMAYANTDIRGEGSGCLLWFNDLLDIRACSNSKGGQDIFVRMASSELDHALDSSVFKKDGGTNIKIILIGVFLAVFVISLSTWLWYAWRKRHLSPQTEEGGSLNVGESGTEAMELPLFSFSRVSKATADFSLDNKLGEGGFGPVYKGMLEDGQEIAVKRLSNTSSQGINEFMNEVICISKLQHRNLVKLLGCSIDGDEKLLIYEFMPNRSLDQFIFGQYHIISIKSTIVTYYDKRKSALLDWTKRLDIIKGIARGLLYLHQDSRLRIIHRDLKASNILLDVDMNPKISDFGIARSFGGNETEANTERVVGTYGYMSPEYALDGLFSIKSDVFSFGVLVLEIVSGKRNRGFVHSEHNNNLIGHAWRMHSEGKSMELLDSNFAEASNPSEVLRSIEVGLLCVQQSPEDRPNMSSVVFMLGNEGALPKPKQPAFFTDRNLPGTGFSSASYPTSSSNELTFTEIAAR